MEVYLDNDVLKTEATTLGGVIDAGLLQLGEQGRLIVEIRLDGKTLKASQVEQHMPQPIQAQEVQLITADKFTLAEQTMLEIREALTGAGSLQQQAAELLQSDQPADAMVPLKHALAIWQQTQQSVQQATSLMKIDLDKLTVNDVTAMDRIQTLTQPLRDAVDQLNNQDWVALGDTLGYEMPGAINGWTELIDTIVEEMAKQQEEQA